MVPLFGLVRRLGKNWWVWGAALMIVFAAFVSVIAPVYIGYGFLLLAVHPRHHASRHHSLRVSPLLLAAASN